MNIHDGESDGNLRTVNYGFDTLLISPIFRDILILMGKWVLKSFGCFNCCIQLLETCYCC